MHVIKEKEGISSHHNRTNTVLVAALIILAGLIFLGNNLGYIQTSIFRIIISWQMLLIVLGILSFSKKNICGGIILTGVGLFFIVPRLAGTHLAWVGTYWPLLIVLVGILVLIKVISPESFCHKRWHKRFDTEASYVSEEGFVTSTSSFGSVRQIVVDPVFKGAKINNHFGGTVLDLRRTALGAPETYIDIDCSFGGIEIFVPFHWTVKSDIHNFFSGVDDKRYNNGMESDIEHKLIIRGNLSFGGIEIKS